MAVSLFKLKFGKDPQEFCGTEEVVKFVEEKIGKPLELQTRHANICSPRGSILPIVAVSTDEEIDKALRE